MKTFPYPKSFLLIGYFTFFSIYSFGQKAEINLNAYSGLFSFRGKGATNSSRIESGFYTGPAYTRNAYGKKSAFSYSVEVQALKDTKTHFLYGAGLSYELLTSKVNIDTVGFSGDPAYLLYPATGSTKLKNSYINLNPFLGKRFITNKVSIDLLAGLDLGICLNSREKGSATSVTSKEKFTTTKNRAKPTIDLGPRIQLQAQCKKVGILLGYSFGLINYQVPGNGKAYTNFLRIGISYSIYK